MISVKVKGNYFSFIFFSVYIQKYFGLMWLFIKEMLDISLQLSGFYVIIYFGHHGFDKVKAYLIQLLILMGKFHIHKIKWSGSKPNFSNFINENSKLCC